MLREVLGVAVAFGFVAVWFKAIVSSDAYWIAAAVVVGLVALVLLRPAKDIRDPREMLERKEVEAKRAAQPRASAPAERPYIRP